MGNVYASVSDILAIGRTLTVQQQESAEVLLTQASAKLRVQARNYGKDIDAMIADTETGEDYALAVKSVIVNAVCRALDSTTTMPVASESQSGLGYAASVTYTVPAPGQDLYFLRNELRDLGLKQQVYGAIEFYDV